MLKSAELNTTLGPMLAIADEHVLYLLEFVDRRALRNEIKRLQLKTKSTIVPGWSKPLDLIKQELDLYFKGELKDFQTPYQVFGTPFQKRVWEELQKIPFGKTCSYAELARLIQHPSAFRAVAQANGANQLAIIIPCHRVINTNGNLGGYGGSVARKRWLLSHETATA